MSNDILSMMFESGDVAKLGAHTFTVFAATTTVKTFTVDQLVKMTGINQNQVIRSLKSLEAAGYLTI